MVQAHKCDGQMSKHGATPAPGHEAAAAAAAAGVPAHDGEAQTGLTKRLQPKPARKGNSKAAKVRGHAKAKAPAKTLRTRLQHQVMPH